MVHHHQLLTNIIHSFWVGLILSTRFSSTYPDCQTEVLFTEFKITCGQTSNRGQASKLNYGWVVLLLTENQPKNKPEKECLATRKSWSRIFKDMYHCMFYSKSKKEGQMCKSICCWIATPFSSHFLLKSSDKKGSFNCSLQMKPESLHCPSMMSSAMMVICPPCYQQWVVVERQKRLSIQCFSHKNPTVVRSETARS